MGLDMLQRLKKHDEIVVGLLNEGMVIKALDYALDYNVHSMRESLFQAVVNQLRTDGKEKEADNIIKRMADIRKFDAIRLSQDSFYKPILIE